MAFNFLSGYSHNARPYDPTDNSIYSDPRRVGSVGSFNPFALSNFNMATQSAPAPSAPPAPTTTTTPAPPPPAPPAPPPSAQGGNRSPFAGNTSQAPASGPAATYQVQPDVGQPTSPYNPQAEQGTPIPKPGMNYSTSNNAGGIDYARYRTIGEAYANHANGLPPNWDWNAWAAATGNQDALRRSTSGDYMNFTWNPNGSGFYNPQTGEMYDRYGETIRRP